MGNSSNEKVRVDVRLRDIVVKSASLVLTLDHSFFLKESEAIQTILGADSARMGAATIPANLQREDSSSNSPY